MTLTTGDIYLIFSLLVLVAAIGLNEAGYGAITFLPLMLLEVWLISKVNENEKPGI